MSDKSALNSAAPAFLCAARHSDTGANDPQDCDWPFCGCDPYADKVIAALQECGALKESPVPALRVSSWINTITNACQVFDGWHNDGTVWSEWDESVRKELSQILSELHSMEEK